MTTASSASWWTLVLPAGMRMASPGPMTDVDGLRNSSGSFGASPVGPSSPRCGRRSSCRRTPPCWAGSARAAGCRPARSGLPVKEIWPNGCPSIWATWPSPSRTPKDMPWGEAKRTMRTSPRLVAPGTGLSVRPWPAVSPSSSSTAATPRRSPRFWAAVLDYRVLGREEDGAVEIGPAEPASAARRPTLVFGPVADPTPGKLPAAHRRQPHRPRPGRRAAAAAGPRRRPAPTWARPARRTGTSSPTPRATSSACSQRRLDPL